MEKIELIYDHYKDTFEYQKKNLTRRNYYSLVCLGIILLFSFQIKNPEQTTLVTNELIKKNVADVKIDFNYINNILTFSFLWIVILYYQIVFLIEKQYSYLHKLEEYISKEIIPLKISREGNTYLRNYPILSSFIHYVYTILFPILICIISFYKLSYEKEIVIDPFANGYFILNAIFLFMVIITSILYLSFIHFNDFKKNNNGRF